MKKILFSFLFLLIAGTCKAEDTVGLFRSSVPAHSYVSGGVNITTRTTALTAIGGGLVYGNSASIKSIHIMFPGINSKIEVFDSRTSSSAAGIRNLYGAIRTSTQSGVNFQNSYYFDTFCASGIVINNSGDIPAEIALEFSAVAR